MRLDYLCPLFLVVAFACGGDDDDDTTIDAAAGEPADAGTGTGADAGDGDGGTTATLCGGIQGLECEDPEYCDWDDDSCGAADNAGACLPRPSDCDRQGPAVCGCDGMRYDNACLAARAGADVSALSSCGP